MPLAIGVLVASLLGSVHCAGMCGGFVCFYAGGAGSGTRAHVAYNAGRLVSYLVLGLLAGLVGTTFDRLGALAGLSRGAAILSGTLMVVWGLSTLLAIRGVRLLHLEGRFGGNNPLGALLARVRGRSATVRAAAIGLLTTLLPCGWLYAFVAAAAGTGSVARALLTMGVFWLGTLPMMLAAGYGMQRLSGPLRSRLPMVTATAVVVMGLLSIAGKMHIEPQALARAGASATTVPSASHGHH
ncbi:MAG: sulfite exporter TauE/SafE family protein [Gemmatimonadaceae bacterium]